MKAFINCLKNPKFAFGAIVSIVLVVIALIGPSVAIHDPLEMNTTYILQDPSIEFPLGTDEYGRCILSRVLVGIRPSLTVALIGCAIAFSGGTFLGMMAGYYNKKLSGTILRAMDVILSFPPILLAMLIVGIWGEGIKNLTIVVGILYLPHFTRISYSETLKVKEQEYVENEISIGASTSRVFMKIIFPNILSSLVIQISFTISNAILLESGLSFLGLGVVPPAPSWGQMIGDAKGFILINPLYIVWPSIFLCLTILAINLMGDALRDILDPKLRTNL